MHTTGEYIGASITTDGEAIISFAVDDDVIEKMEKLLLNEVIIDIQKLYGHRSKQANAYFWKLLSLIGNKLGGVSKDTLYEMKLKEYGVFEDYTLPTEAVDAFSKVFRFTEPQYYFSTDIVDSEGNIKPIGMVCLRCWKGSHQYDTKEMSDLINGTVNDAKDLGVDTWTQAEIDIALKYWEAQE